MATPHPIPTSLPLHAARVSASTSNAAATGGAALPSSAPATNATTTPVNIYGSFPAVSPWTAPSFIAGAVLLAAALALSLPAIRTRIARGRRPSADAWQQGPVLSSRRTAAAAICLVAGAAFLVAGIFLLRGTGRVALTFSSHAMLAAEWRSYKARFVISTSSSTARTVDPSQGDITTSEAESYTLLRAAWMDDQPTFDANWQWTQQNLQRPDHLFSWLYGQRPDGTYGILTARGGQNTASDADSDIALSLLFAYARWQQPQYLAAAQQVISSIWQHEVVYAAGKPYLAADNLEQSSTSPVAAIDPSYLSPYAYRIFAAADPSHPWNTLVDDSYAVLEASVTSTLDTPTTADLPPDWMGINKTTGAIVPLATSTADTHYGYDAMRVPWRLALDWQWNHDPRDQAILNRMGFLKGQWTQNGALDAVYGHNGAPLGTYEAPAVYGGDIGYFLVSDPADAAAVYTQKLLILYDPGADDWRVPLGYYDANWAWFGTALYNGELPNLAASIPSSAFANTVPTATGSSTAATGTLP